MMTEAVLVPSLHDDEAGSVASTRMSPTSSSEEMVVLADPRPVIPVIFLPGIMGTNLRNKHTGRRVWRPLNAGSLTFGSGNWQEVGWAKDFFLATAAERRRWLDPETTEVDPEGKIYYRVDMNDMPGKLEEKRKFRMGLPDLRNPTPLKRDWKHLGINEKVAKHRQYGALMQSAYQPVMVNLEAVLNRVVQGGEVAQSWTQADDMFGMLSDPEEYGEKKKRVTTLTEKEIRNAAQYRFEFWAGGYNWIRSNADSASEVIRYIEDVVMANYRKTLGESEASSMKVVLVTHSMGGLVARAIAGIHGYERVLGSVIGAMPAEGAALTYKMMRTGADSTAMKLIAQGNTAIHLVAQLSNSNGALELLPSSRYGEGGNGWLRLRRTGGGAAGSDDHLPRSADPYSEIYRNRSWYGLVPERNRVGLDVTETQEATGYEGYAGSLNPFADFDSKIDEVQNFHEKIAGECPAPAYVHAGADGHQGRLAYGEVVWNLDSLEPKRFDDMFMRGSPFKAVLQVAPGQAGYSSSSFPELDPLLLPDWMRASWGRPAQFRRKAAELLKVFRSNLRNQIGAGFSLETANQNGIWGDSLNGRVVLGVKIESLPQPGPQMPSMEEQPGILLEEVVISSYRPPEHTDMVAATAEKTGIGDETVPYMSAVSPLAWSGVEAFFAIGDEGMSDASGKRVMNIKGRRTKGYEHQGAYNDNRARWVTLFSLVKLAQRADWK